MCARSQTSPHLAARTLLAIPGLEKPLFNGVLMGFRGDSGRLGRCVKPGCSTFPLPTRQRNGHSPHTASPPRQHPRALGLTGHHEGGRTDGQTDGQTDTTPLPPAAGGECAPFLRHHCRVSNRQVAISGAKLKGRFVGLWFFFNYFFLFYF